MCIVVDICDTLLALLGHLKSKKNACWTGVIQHVFSDMLERLKPKIGFKQSDVIVTCAVHRLSTQSPPKGSKEL